MTTLATRIRALSDLEGFDIRVKDQNGKPADMATNGLPAYPHERAAKGTTTVSDWMVRFTKTYPGYTCDVLLADGTVAHGNSKMVNVRESYEEP